MNLTDEEISEAREALIGVADQLRLALSGLNRYGDVLSGLKLTHQRDGSAYGEVYDGLKLLVEVLYGDNVDEIMEVIFDGDAGVAEAASFVTEKNAPMADTDTETVRDELVRYRAWRRALEDGMVPPERIVSVEGLTPVEATTEALGHLAQKIELCLTALAFRSEPEVAA